MKKLFSIIIPVRKENAYLQETLQQLKKQSFKNFEILIITDKISKKPDPSFKRNLGAKKAKGNYLCFLDDDSYPDKNWLKNIAVQIKKHPDYAAFVGPCLTPPKDNLFQQASGLFWSSFLGSGGAGQYRNFPQKSRFVDDYPTVNFTIKKSVFQKIGGFNSKYWPGEDTILCLDLINNQQKIYYHPSIKVFHHRRSILIPHLKQISRYALHRGLFARKFPKNSLKIGYLMPSLFLIYLLTLPISHFYWPFCFYLLLLFITFIIFLFNYSSIQLSLLTILTIPITHLYYGLLFIIGLLKFDLKFKAHPVDQQTGKYLGG
ncbi:MAG: glycosyltransferase [Candidatus Shapirobacteria bacterium]|jgi:cellulose synthase/poly-beta-1,6-N-acetylglucosamine synthase-like glycosyltransferase